MDSDEGIRIEDPNGRKKIFINRNLLGTFIVLVRTTKIDDKIEREKKFIEKIYEFTILEKVIEFINNNINKYKIIVY